MAEPEPIIGPTGDMDPAAFRDYGRRVVDWIAEYLSDPTVWRVSPTTVPGKLRDALPASPPAAGESLDAVLADFERLIVPGLTHWNHPRFFGYFPSSASAPGILAEALVAALNNNALLWQTGPAATELERLTLDWLRQLMGLPAVFQGTINDTASVGTLCALAAAREQFPDLRLREEGLAGRADVPRLRIYCSDQAHSSVDKAAIVLGLGLSGVRRVATDAQHRLDVRALGDAVADDRARGVLPLAVVATVGTTATTAVDPVREIALVCGRERLWLHVDAAYGGAAALLPEMRWVLDGCEQADSLVVNPHKWLFVPMDCSALYTRRPELLRRALSVVPDYLTTSHANEGLDLMDYGVALGRRFRSLKLWFVLRCFGADGLAARIREHLRLAQQFAVWVDAEPNFERLAPTQFSVVLFRHRPDSDGAAWSGDPHELEHRLEAHNRSLLQRLNATGEVFLSHSAVDGKFALRLAIGNLRTTEEHVLHAWRLVQRLASQADPSSPG
jgi:aromatic-L-amino-acid decarboxylase